ncbi:CCHC-type domain-containing protein, partial [Trichonephila clavipes]
NGGALTDLPRNAWGILSNGLKSTIGVANFNKWDDMMCLANVYFFLDGIMRQWYVNNEDALDSGKQKWTMTFGDRQRYTRRAEEQLKCRAQRVQARKYTQSYIQSVLDFAEKTDVEKRADNRPVCFTGRPGHVSRYCRERKAVFDNSRNRRRNLTTLALKKKYADQTLAVLRQVPQEADPQYVVTDPSSPYRRSSQSPGRRSEENSRRATFQGGEAACTEILRRPPR